VNEKRAELCDRTASIFGTHAPSDTLTGEKNKPIIQSVRSLRWNPVQCLWPSLLFGGGAQALGPALQTVGVTSYYYLFNASPFILTLAVMILTCSNKRTLSGVPGALGDRT